MGDLFAGLLDLWGIFVVLCIVAYLMKKGDVATKKPTEKACPPHAWKWMEQPGVEGAWFIKCQKCQMLPSLTGRDTP